MNQKDVNSTNKIHINETENEKTNVRDVFGEC